VVPNPSPSACAMTAPLLHALALSITHRQLPCTSNQLHQGLLSSQSAYGAWHAGKGPAHNRPPQFVRHILCKQQPMYAHPGCCRLTSSANTTVGRATTSNTVRLPQPEARHESHDAGHAQPHNAWATHCMRVKTAVTAILYDTFHDMPEQISPSANTLKQSHPHPQTAPRETGAKGKHAQLELLQTACKAAYDHTNTLCQPTCTVSRGHLAKATLPIYPHHRIVEQDQHISTHTSPDEWPTQAQAALPSGEYVRQRHTLGWQQ
jgi:hypothetical protein